METCPGCNKILTWNYGHERYHIGVSEESRTEFTTLANGRKISHIFCTCGRLIAVNMDTKEGSEVFINSENFQPDVLEMNLSNEIWSDLNKYIDADYCWVSHGGDDEPFLTTEKNFKDEYSNGEYVSFSAPDVDELGKAIIEKFKES